MRQVVHLLAVAPPGKAEDLPAVFERVNHRLSSRCWARSREPD